MSGSCGKCSSDSNLSGYEQGCSGVRTSSTAALRCMKSLSLPKAEPNGCTLPTHLGGGGGGGLRLSQLGHLGGRHAGSLGNRFGIGGGHLGGGKHAARQGREGPGRVGQ